MYVANWRDEFSIKVTSLDYVIVYIADMAARFGSTDADEFTLQQQNVKTKAITKYNKPLWHIHYIEMNPSDISTI
jgi:hypothetical protein